jgi:hypothetical protein
MTSSSSSPPARRRAPALVILDAAAAILLLILSAAVSVGVVVTAFAYSGVHAQCGAGPYSGLTCNSVVLAIVVYGLMIIAVLAAFLALGMMIVSAIRKRYLFWWPLGAIIVTVALFYLGSWVAGMTVP